MQKNFMIFFLSFMYMFNTNNFMLEQSGLINKNLYLDIYTNLLILMIIMVMYMSKMSMMKSPMSMKMTVMLLLITIMFSYMFLSINLFVFYILFEMSVIPLMYFISMWGYSLERLKSMFYMFLYTFIFSLPFFFLMLYYSKTKSFNIMEMMKANLDIPNYIILLMFLMFLVKMPMWSMHLWLTKAHVDASTEGSMILAGVVLKLSGMGLIKLSFLQEMMNYDKILMFILIFSMLGSILMSLQIMRQTDMKMMVALSSIVHMFFMFLLFVYNQSFAFFNLIIVMLSHGLVSPIMFFFLGETYNNTSTRSMFMMKGVLITMKMLSVIWFLVIIMNMGMPITMNFISEFMFFFSSLLHSKTIMLLSGLLIFFNGLFNMYMYTIMSSGENNTYVHLKFDMKMMLMIYKSMLILLFMMFFF